MERYCSLGTIYLGFICNIILFRRWNDEIIVSDSTSDEDTRRASNRANDLLVNFLDNRYPGLLQSFEDEDHIR